MTNPSFPHLLSLFSFIFFGVGKSSLPLQMPSFSPLLCRIDLSYCVLFTPLWLFPLFGRRPFSGLKANEQEREKEASHKQGGFLFGLEVRVCFFHFGTLFSSPKTMSFFLQVCSFSREAGIICDRQTLLLSLTRKQ